MHSSASKLRRCTKRLRRRKQSGKSCRRRWQVRHRELRAESRFVEKHSLTSLAALKDRLNIQGLLSSSAGPVASRPTSSSSSTSTDGRRLRMELKRCKKIMRTSLNALKTYTADRDTDMMEQTSESLKRAWKKVEGELTSSVPDADWWRLCDHGSRGEPPPS